MQVYLQSSSAVVPLFVIRGSTVTAIPIANLDLATPFGMAAHTLFDATFGAATPQGGRDLQFVVEIGAPTVTVTVTTTEYDSSGNLIDVTCTLTPGYGDFSSDPNNCGTCGVSGGPDCCNGTPVDLSSDRHNCGACGNVVPDSDGTSCCFGVFVNLNSDSDNCGSCGNVAKPNPVTGSCVCENGQNCGCENGAAACASPGSGHGGGCFPLSGSVLIRRGSSAVAGTVGDLRSGDVVRAVLPGGVLGWSAVFVAHGHTSRTLNTEFVELRTLAGATLRLSYNHFLPVAAGDPTCSKGYAASAWTDAGSVVVGDGVWVVSSSSSPDIELASRALRCSAVVSTSHSWEVGFAQPITLAFTIVVDGVVATTYAVPAQIFDPMKYVRYPWLAHFSSRVVYWPVRVAFQVLTAVGCDPLVTEAVVDAIAFTRRSVGLAASSALAAVALPPETLASSLLVICAVCAPELLLALAFAVALLRTASLQGPTHRRASTRTRTPGVV